jgi:hypothetical protein
MLLPALQEMIETGAWWDFCDEISGVALARLLQAEPARDETRAAPMGEGAFDVAAARRDAEPALAEDRL